MILDYFWNVTLISSKLMRQWKEDEWFISNLSWRLTSKLITNYATLVWWTCLWLALYNLQHDIWDI